MTGAQDSSEDDMRNARKTGFNEGVIRGTRGPVQRAGRVDRRRAV